jgi:hypothetical protein
LALGPARVFAAQEAPRSGLTEKGWPTVHAAFIYPPSARLKAPGAWWSWPGNDFDAEGRQAAYTKALADIERKLNMRVRVQPAPLDSKEAAAGFIHEVKQSKPEGLLLLPFHHPAFEYVDAILNEVGAKVSNKEAGIELGIPAIIYTPLGGKHGSLKKYQRPGVHMIQSLDNFEAIEYALRMIRTAWTLRNSRILSVAGAAEAKESAVPFWGTKVRILSLQRFADQVQRTEINDAVRQLAQAYVKGAKKVLEPREPEILTAARLHFALKRMLAEEKADAITMDCLRRGELMPCMSFMTLRDEGIAAGCENDLDGTITLMLIQLLFGRPGFQHNPCFETERNHYFASHCTSASKLFGASAPAEPYLLRSYAHTNDPTCVPQVLWREGQEVTMARYVSGKTPQLLVYSGKVVKSYDMPPVGGCRTNVEITINELDDACDVKGHHNVLFYGNQAKRLRQFAQLYGVTVVT